MEYSDIRKSLVFEVNNSRQQFIYYILGLSTACIAYLITKIDKWDIHDNVSLLLLQVVGIAFFAFSVLFGLKYVRAYQNYMSKEVAKIDVLTNSIDGLLMQTLNEVLSGQAFRLHPDQLELFKKNTIASLDAKIEKMVSNYNRLYKWTLNMFYLGMLYTVSLVILEKLAEKYSLAFVYDSILSFF